MLRIATYHALSKIKRYLGLELGRQTPGLEIGQAFGFPFSLASVSKLRASLRFSRRSWVIVNLLSTVIASCVIDYKHEESLWHWFLYILAKKSQLLFMRSFFPMFTCAGRYLISASHLTVGLPNLRLDSVLVLVFVGFLSLVFHAILPDSIAQVDC